MRETSPTPNEADDWLTARRFALLLALCVLASWPQVFLGLQTFVYRDFGYYAYPIAYYLKQSFWRGEIPLWSPLSYCGTPFLAQWNTQALYPPALFYILLPLSWSLGVFCLLHLYLGGLGMFFLARRWTQNSLASAVAAMAFAFSGLMLNSVMWPGTIPGLGWMPWVIWLVERAWRNGRRQIVLAALVGALQMLSGAVEVILMTWIVLGALWLVDFVSRKIAREKIFWRAATVVLLVSGLCAAQILPFLELLNHSNRQDNFNAALWPMPVTGWANFLVPLFHAHRSFEDVFQQTDQYWTYSYYVGIFTVALAGWAVWRARNARVLALALLTLLCLVLALGDATKFYTWCARHIFVIKLMRFPVKFVILPVFALPLLAAFGLAKKSDAFRRRRDWQFIWFIVVVLMLDIFWWTLRLPQPHDDWTVTLQNGAIRGLFFTTIVFVWFAAEKTSALKSRRLLQILLLVLMWLDVSHHAPQPQTVSRSVYEPDYPRDFATPRFGESRAMISHWGIDQFNHSFIPRVDADYVSRRYALFSNCNLLDGIPKVDGFFPMQIREQREIHLEFYAVNAPKPEPAPLLDFLGASQITSQTNIFDWTPRTNFMPMLTGGQKPFFTASADKMVGAILGSNFNPRAEVWLPASAKTCITATNAAAVKISAAQFSAHRITARIEADAPALVVIAQSFYPCWHAYVDGHPTELLRANYAFQAVQIPTGTHELRLAYEDRKFFIGSVISLSTLLLCALIWLGFTRGKPSPVG